MNTMTVLAKKIGEDRTWLESTSGFVGIYEELIHDIAQQRLAIAGRKSYLDLEQDQAPSTVSSREQQHATATRAVVNLDQLFPDKPRLRPREATFTPLQEWEGYVVDVGKETFTARLIDLTSNDAQEEEEADFPVTDLSDSDQQMLRPGAIFRWAIGYRRTRGGTKERISRIVFRRLPAWTARELKENRRKAEELAAALQGE
jgi:hypothetical protein